MANTAIQHALSNLSLMVYFSSVNLVAKKPRGSRNVTRGAQTRDWEAAYDHGCAGGSGVTA
jgi:hypothetical protein